MQHHFKALLTVAACLLAAPAQAAWTDWFTDLFAELDTDGLYAGASLGVTKVTGQLDRRLGGPGDDQGGAEPGGFFIAEPGFNTTATLRGGWLPIPYLGIEARYGRSIESDQIENADNTQTIRLDSIYGIYLTPQYTYADSITLIGSAGYTDFDFSIEDQNDGPRRFTDSGFSWGGAIRLQLSPSGTVAFEYTQHYDEDDGRVFDVGVSVNYWFGKESEDTGFY